ncbi:MAG TPA: hypothetical protein VNK41_09625 [Vicinamibacterales bacterium]|nr:hypothetical protein [Vicinamibacterales bacterium]
MNPADFRAELATQGERRSGSSRPVRAGEVRSMTNFGMGVLLVIEARPWEGL